MATVRQITVLIVAFGSSGAALASPVNTGFETGTLAGWTTTGVVNNATSEFARDPLDPFQGVPASGFWDPYAGSHFASIYSSDPSGSSTMEQTFAGIMGETLRFAYYMDFGDLDIGTSDRLYGEIVLPDTTVYTFFDVSREDDLNFDWEVVEFVLPATGMFTLRFGAEDGDPGGFESVLGIDGGFDNVIPLPTASLLAGAGIALVACRRRRIL